MNYSNASGFIPQTREQRISALFREAASQGFTSNYTEFKGSNIHKLHSSSTIPALEALEESTVVAINNIFSYFEQHYKSIIAGSFGASYEGWHNVFKELCQGLNIVDASIDASLGAAGSVALYFDQLTSDQELLQKAFLKCVWPGMISVAGDYAISLNFSASDAKTYHYFNLQPHEYTKLYVQAYISYKQGAAAYEPQLVRKSVIEQFNATNRIGRGFYHHSYFDHSALPGIASMRLLSSLDNVSWLEGDRQAAFGQKYVIAGLEVMHE